MKRFLTNFSEPVIPASRSTIGIMSGRTGRFGTKAGIQSVNSSLRIWFKTWIPTFVGVTFFCSSLILPLHSQEKDPIQEFSERVKKVTLANGLRVLVVERPFSPTVSLAMYLRTGGLDDDSGKSGLAHMFEHMLFKGTKTIGTKNYQKEVPLLDKMDELQETLLRCADKTESKKILDEIHSLEKEHADLLIEEEFWKIYERSGASDLNASTGYDFTDYTISLPVNYLPLWAEMEVDRLRNPVLREFYKERAVVLEERRMRIENSPQGKLWEAFLATAFMAHPYSRPIVGWESDVSRLTRKDAEKFFADHYGIDRLVITVVGGINSDHVIELVRKHFESIPVPRSRSRELIPVEPSQEGERRVEVIYDAEPRFVAGYHRPDMKHPDDAIFVVLEQILNGGRTSRFYRNVVEKKKIGLSAWASSSFPGERDPNLFVLGGSPRPPHNVWALEKALYEEIEKIQTENVSDEELRRVKNNIEASVIKGLSSNLGLAKQLGYYESLAGDWGYLLRSLEAIRKVTAEDVSRVARDYLRPSNRTVAVLVRKK